jgi:hypothetical protein
MAISVAELLGVVATGMTVVLRAIQTLLAVGCRPGTVVRWGTMLPSTMAPGLVRWRPDGTGRNVRSFSSITASGGIGVVWRPSMIDEAGKLFRISWTRLKEVNGFSRRVVCCACFFTSRVCGKQEKKLICKGCRSGPSNGRSVWLSSLKSGVVSFAFSDRG